MTGLTKIPNARELMAELRRLRFEDTWDSLGGGCRMVEYTLVRGARKLIAQLWADGQHRLSHFHDNFSAHGCMCTDPTHFFDTTTLRAAVRRELTRSDHKHAEPVAAGHELEELAR